jgi:hypothetical protein
MRNRAVSMQLVAEHAKEAPLVLKEGAVGAVVDFFESAKYLIGSDSSGGEGRAVRQGHLSRLGDNSAGEGALYMPSRAVA